MKDSLNKLFSMPLMVLFLLFFFFAIGGATFVEATYGTPVAQKWVYKARWFEFIMLYLSASLIFNIIRFKLFRLKKIASLLFHLAFLVVVLGSLVTRYWGFEGIMKIREGQASNEIITQESYFMIKAHDGEMQYTNELPMVLDTNDVAYVYPGTKGGDPINWLANLLFDHNNYFEHEFEFKGKDIKINCVDVIKNPKDTIYPEVGGAPHIELVTGSEGGRTYHYIKSGTAKVLESGLKVSFNNNDFTDAVKISETDSGLVVMSPYDLEYLQMSDQSNGSIVRDSLQEFIPKRLYMVGNASFAFNQYYLGARTETIRGERDMEGLLAITLKIDDGTDTAQVMLKGGKGRVAFPTYVQVGELFYELSYGSKVVEIPFYLHLRDFQRDNYPGGMKAASFASEVTLIDQEEGLNEDYRIYMNNVLDHKGYRFFQSSYDPDELGTVLSVNKDRPGTVLTYIGYFLLGLGFLINLFHPGSRFRMLIKKSGEVRIKREGLGILLLLLSLSFNARSQLPEVPEDHADKFSRLIVLSNDRLKPVHTLAGELIRKIHRGTDYEGQNAVQVFVGMQIAPFAWYQEPIVYVSGKELRDEYNLDGKYGALVDFFDFSSRVNYLLYDQVQIAARKPESRRSQYDKDLLKTDERLNILFGLLGGHYLKIFPKPNDPNKGWFSPADPNMNFEYEDSTFVSGVMKLYFAGASKGIQTGDWSDANSVVDLIGTYQNRAYTFDDMPSEANVNLEIQYNKANIFKRLMNIYFGMALIILVLAFVQIFVPRLNLKWPIGVATWIFALLFVIHGIGLGVRWYLSGHAPWSNGYEAVVFIAFVAIIPGLVLSMKNKVVLGATGILAWLLMFVAHMNQMDPEITSLVPVLKSYWLMIHVAIITGSYAFLGLGAILALIILITNLFIRPSNRKKITLLSKELTHISEMVLTIGLFMLTIGTFLGGVWANESWGRYWGWDPKETWALASVLIYAVVIHLRFVPKLKSQFAFNAASLWAFGSIIMTFFGVNYYLAGLHSYAKGDPVPVPDWVPVTVLMLFALKVVSGLKVRQSKKMTEKGKEETS